MIALLAFVASLAALLQFVSYCRSVLASARNTDLSEQVLEVTGVEDRTLTAEDFDPFMQLVRLCPEHVTNRTELRAVERYYRLLQTVDRTFRKLIPGVASWAVQERQSCAYFAAVVLDHCISSSREMCARHAMDYL